MTRVVHSSVEPHCQDPNAETANRFVLNGMRRRAGAIRCNSRPEARGPRLSVRKVTSRLRELLSSHTTLQGSTVATSNSRSAERSQRGVHQVTGISRFASRSARDASRELEISIRLMRAPPICRRVRMSNSRSLVLTRINPSMRRTIEHTAQA